MDDEQYAQKFVAALFSHLEDKAPNPCSNQFVLDLVQRLLDTFVEEVSTSNAHDIGLNSASAPLPEFFKTSESAPLSWSLAESAPLQVFGVGLVKRSVIRSLGSLTCEENISVTDVDDLLDLCTRLENCPEEILSPLISELASLSVAEMSTKDCASADVAETQHFPFESAAQMVAATATAKSHAPDLVADIVELQQALLKIDEPPQEPSATAWQAGSMPQQVTTAELDDHRERWTAELDQANQAALANQAAQANQAATKIQRAGLLPTTLSQTAQTSAKQEQLLQGAQRPPGQVTSQPVSRTKGNKDKGKIANIQVAGAPLPVGRISPGPVVSAASASCSSMQPVQQVGMISSVVMASSQASSSMQPLQPAQAVGLIASTHQLPPAGIEVTEDTRALSHDEEIPSHVTTLVVRNIPVRLSQAALSKLWPAGGSWNVLFAPYNHRQHRTSGYAFINFVNHAAMLEFRARWLGTLLTEDAEDCLTLGITAVQGLEANLRYMRRNKTIRNTTRTKHMPIVILTDGIIADFRMVMQLTQLDSGDEDGTDDGAGTVVSSEGIP